jgi:outer membrane protein
LSRTGGNVTYTGNPPSGREFNSVVWTIQLTVPLLRPGSIENFREARVQNEAAQAQFAFAEQDLMLRVAQAYFDVAAARETVAAADSEMTATREQLAIARRSYEKGVASVTDVDESTARSELAVATHVAAQTGLENKRTELSKIIGTAPTPLAGLTPGSLELSPALDSIDQWSSQARVQNLKVVGLEAAVRVSQLEVQKAQLQRLPTLDAVVSYGRNFSSGNNTNPFDYGTNAQIKQAGVQFSLPLLDGGALHAQVAESRARQHKAEADLEAARRQAAADAREAYEGVLEGMAQITALDAAIRASENAVKGSQAGYRLGIRINSDVLNAQRERFAAQRDLVRARYDTLMQWLKLKASIGALRGSDLTWINSMLAQDPESAR